MINPNKVSVGADPELFLFYPKQKQYIPAIGMLGGTKDNPKPLSREGFAVQEDNVMAEFNIPPAWSEEEFVEHIEWGKQQIQLMVNPALQVVAHSSATFQENHLAYEQAKISGCDPYNNAWKNGEIEEAIDLGETTNRDAGGHIHLGFPNPTNELRMRLTRGLDLFLAVPGVLLDRNDMRRTTYGRAGAYREKEYGVEYRTLSNFWVANTELIKWVYRNVFAAIDFIKENDPESSVEEVINTSDLSGAKNLINKYNVEMPKL